MKNRNDDIDDDIDLFDLFQTLWDGKWIISFYISVTLVISHGIIFLQENKALPTSELILSADTLPPFYNHEMAFDNFQKKFYTKSAFESWKKNNDDASIVFEDLSPYKMADGFLMSKPESERLITFVFDKMFEKKGEALLIVKSNQLSILNDSFKYATYINELVRDEYVVRADEELKIIESRVEDFSSSDSGALEKLLSIERYLASTNNGANVLTIGRPTMPTKDSLGPLFTLAFAVTIGGMIGVFVILVRSAQKKRSEK